MLNSGRIIDLHARAQSDVTSAERKVFGDLRLSRFLQSGEEKSQCRLCVVSSFASLSLSLSELEFQVCRCHLPSFDLAPLSRNLSFIVFFVFQSDQIGFSLFVCLFFYREGHGLTEKWLLIIFIFWEISSTFHCVLILCAEALFPFWRKSQHR